MRVTARVAYLRLMVVGKWFFILKARRVEDQTFRQRKTEVGRRREERREQIGKRRTGSEKRDERKKGESSCRD